MKKFTKIILIIAGSLAALGIVFSGIAAVMGAGWSTIHRKALAGELDFGNWHIGNGVYYAYDQGHGILDHFWDDDYDDWDDDYDDDDDCAAVSFGIPCFCLLVRFSTCYVRFFLFCVV